MTNKIDILLARYFAGEATEKELQLLDCWLAESGEHEAYFEQLTMLYQKSVMPQETQKWNTEEALFAFQNHIQTNESVVSKKRFKLSPLHRAVAASALLLIGLFTFFLLYNPKETIQLASEDTVKKITIFDNTEIILEPNSQIEYSVDKENEIKLQGKATFIVQGSRQNQGLLILAGNTFIRDIGTIFTVDAHNAEAIITVEVSEGEVLFYTKENEGVHIKENEKAIYNTQTKKFEHIVIEETDEEITFTASQLDEVVQLLSIRYKTNISLADRSLEKMQITVSFDKNESIDIILDIITETLNLNLSKEGDKFIISH